MIAFLENSCHICRLRSSNNLELLAVGCLQVRSHIVSAKPQADLEIFVAKDLFFLAENRVCVSRVKCSKMLKARFGGRHQADMNRLVGVGKPFNKCVSIWQIKL